jgi:hypothetical protein
VHRQAYDIGGNQIRYDGIWEDGGNRGQTRAIVWAIDDFAKRFNDELSAGRRCVHMQAYDIGGGQIRYDGVWEASPGVHQTRAIAWAISDFANRFNDELTAGRHCVHIQAYDIGGNQIRYDGIWENGGNRGQTRAIAWASNDFVGRSETEAAIGKRLVLMQAYDIGGGQIRYDGVWEIAPGNQKRCFGLTLAAFAERFDELTSWGGAPYHLELMTVCRRDYAQATAVRSAKLPPGAVGQGFPGSDIDHKPSALTRLPAPVEVTHATRPLCRLEVSSKHAS